MQDFVEFIRRWPTDDGSPQPPAGQTAWDSGQAWDNNVFWS